MAYVPDVPNNKDNIMQERFDKFAIMLSGLCTIHCIVTPILASIVPLFSAAVHHGEDVHHFWFHQAIILFILPVSLIALFAGYRSHKELVPIIIAGIGLSILTFTALFAEHLLHDNLIDHTGETLLTITGGIIHAVGHILNIIATRKKQPECTST